jgi:hypothetical protein
MPKAAIAVFPGEYPTDKDLTDWLEVVLPALRLSYGAIMRGSTPSHLVHLEHGADDLSGYTVLPADAQGLNAAQIQQHNRRVVEATAARDARAATLLTGLREHKDQLAQVMIAALRPKAPLRLERLLVTHRIAGSGCCDGAGMIRDLEALKGTTSQVEETRDHDRAVEHMRDNPLCDGCAASEFADRVNTLVSEHVPHLERPLTAGALGKFIIKLMPPANAAEGRSLIRRLSAAQLQDTPVVIEECIRIVHESSTPAARATAMAARAIPAAENAPGIKNINPVLCL